MPTIRLPRRLQSLFVVVLAGAALPQVTFAQNGLFDFADLVNDALEGLTQPKEEVVVEAFDVMELGGPAAPVPASVLKERNARVDAYAACLMNWVAEELQLSESEQEALQAAIDEKCTQIKETKTAQNRNNMPGHMALKFTEDGALASRIDVLFSRKGLQELPLSDEQKEQLKAAFSRRKEHLANANIGQAINLIDGQFFLTQQQRKELAGCIANRLDVTRPCFSFMPQTYYFKQQALTPVVAAVEVAELWSPAQKARADALGSTPNDGNNGQYLMFQMNGGTEDWDEQLQKHMTDQTEKMLTAMQVQVDYFKRLSTLSDQDTFYLQVAAKGAVDAAMTAWKRSTLQQLDRNREAFANRMGNIAFSIQTPRVESTQQNEIWSATLAELSPRNVELSKDRVEAIKDATAAYMVGLLDRELWLSDAQRTSLLKSIRKEVPAEGDGLMNQEYFRALSYLCVPMFKLSKEDLKVLSPEQKQAWQVLKKPFSMNGQYVQFETEHGQMMFEMMGARQNQRQAVGVGFF
ncbi:MAG: hypothetical protein NXI04_05425 [Planctomycetaceae bacterium]|nr:hypothetical protein [Planctomycetaceae bacterium]